MKIIKLTFLAACVLTLIEGAPLEKAVDECIANYVKSKGLVDEKFGTDDEVTELCKNICKLTSMNSLNNVMKQLEDYDDYKNYTHCAVKKAFMFTSVPDELLTLYTYQKDDSILSEDEKNEKINELSQRISIIVTGTVIDCQTDEKIGKVFEQLIDPNVSVESELSPEQDFCVRKHIIDNNLLNNQIYDLDSNPNDIDGSSLNCDEIYPQVVVQIEDEIVSSAIQDVDSNESIEAKLSEEQKTCIDRVARDGNYVEKLLPYEYLHEFELSKDLKNYEKHTFITLVKSMGNDIALECFMKNKNSDEAQSVQ
jgi:hypothetical protein